LNVMPQERKQLCAHGQLLRRSKRSSRIESSVLSDFHVRNADRKREYFAAHFSDLYLPMKLLLELSLNLVVILIYVDERRQRKDGNNNQQDERNNDAD